MMSFAPWVLIITLLGSSSQSGKAVTAIPMASEEACRAAAAKWLGDLPRDPDKPTRYDFSGPVRATCVKGN